MVISSGPNSGVDAAFVVFDPGFSPLAVTSVVEAGLAPSESQGIDHFFRMVRVFFDPKPSGTPPYRSVEGLKLLIQTCGVPDHLRLYLVLSRTFGSASQRLPWSPLTVTSSPWTEALISRVSSV